MISRKFQVPAACAPYSIGGLLLYKNQELAASLSCCPDIFPADPFAGGHDGEAQRSTADAQRKAV